MEQHSQTEIYYPKSSSDAIGHLARLEERSIKFTSGDGDREYSLWKDESSHNNKSVITRIQEFFVGKDGLNNIPSGDRIKVRRAIAEEVLWSPSVAEMRLNIRNGRFPDGFKVNKADDGYFDQIDIDYGDTDEGQKRVDGYNGPRLNELQFIFAVCQENMETWRSKGCKDELKRHKPVVDLLGHTRRTSVPLSIIVMKGNDVLPRV